MARAESKFGRVSIVENYFIIRKSYEQTVERLLGEVYEVHG